MVSISVWESEPPCGMRRFVGVTGSATEDLMEAAAATICASVSKAVGRPDHEPLELWQLRQLLEMMVFTLVK